MIDYLHNPKTVCIDCLNSWQCVNYWWCGAHHHRIRENDSPCTDYKKRGGDYRGGVLPIKTPEEIALEKSKLIDYEPLLAKKSREIKAKKLEEERLNNRKTKTLKRTR